MNMVSHQNIALIFQTQKENNRCSLAWGVTLGVYWFGVVTLTWAVTYPSLPQFLPHCKVGVIIVLTHRFMMMIKSLNIVKFLWQTLMPYKHCLGFYS